MAAKKSRFLLPAEFVRRILDAGAADDPAGWVRAIQEAWASRHPELVKRHPRAYAVPVHTALALYGLDPPRYRRLVTAAIGPPGSPDFWRSLAVSARDALAQGDWSLLGWLALDADAALAAACRGEAGNHPSAPARWRYGPAPPASELIGDGRQLNGGAVSEAFLAALSLESGALSAAAYVSAALGYFRNMPASFLVPPDLIGYADRASPNPPSPSAETPEAASEEDPPDARPSNLASWACLRLFWGRSRWAWSKYPQGLEALAKNSNPWVRVLAAQLHDCREPAPEQPKRPPRFRNPFARLLNPQSAEADEPARAVPRPHLPPPPASPAIVESGPEDMSTLFSDPVEPPCPPLPMRYRGTRWRRVGRFLGRALRAIFPRWFGAARGTSRRPSPSTHTSRAEP